MFWFNADKEESPATHIPDGTRVYAIGDIHGCLDLLNDLHGKILADSADVPPSIRRVAVYLGDYVDRGPDSRGVIDLLLRDPLPGFNYVHLMGNHEEMLLEFLQHAHFGEYWLAAGGAATVKSYGIKIETRRSGLERYRQIRDSLLQAAYPAHLEFLSRLRMTYELGNCLFVHAGIRPGTKLADQTPRDLLWIREAFTQSEADHGKIVVHGHSSRKKIEVRPNRINVDTQACDTKKLSCLVLEGTTYRFLSTQD